MENTSNIKTQYREDRIPTELTNLPQWVIWKPSKLLL